MDSGYEAKLGIIEEQHKKDIQRLEGLNDKKDINAFVDELNQRVKALEEEFDAKQQTVSEQQTFLATQVAKDDRELTEKKLQFAKDLLNLADRKMNPDYYAAKERTSSFVTAKSEPAKRGSLRESLLSRTRTSSIGEAPFKTIRSGSLGVSPLPQASLVTSLKPPGELPTGISKSTGSTSIDNDIEEIERLIKQATGQGYKKENAEEISKYLTNFAAILFLQLRESDVVNPKRHKAKDSTDLRYSQFSNKLFEIVNEPFKRLDEELKKIDAESKSPEQKQTIMQEKEKLIKMLIKISEDLREKRNFIALMSVAAVLDAQINKKANAEIKEKLSEGDLDKIKANMKLYEPGSNELTILQEKYLRDKKSVIPQIGSMKNKFVYIEEYKKDDNKDDEKLSDKEKKAKETKLEYAGKLEDEQLALLRLYQNTLARDLKQNLFHIKFQYSETELHEIEQQSIELRKEITHAPNVEERHKLYEKLMDNLTKRRALLEEQQKLLEKMTNANPMDSKRSKDINMDEANKLRDLKAKRNSLLDETSDTKNAMLFNEAKLISTMNAEQITEKYSKSLPKLLDNLDTIFAKLSDDKIPLPKKPELLKEADIIMHELDIKARAISHRAKDISFSDDKTKPMLKNIEQIAAKKEEFLQIKNGIERSLGRSDSISLHSTSRPK